MSTPLQKNRKLNLKKKKHSRSRRLFLFKKKVPQIKCIVLKVRIVTPKKPNSARRPTVKAIGSGNKAVSAHIPGTGHNLRKHSEVLICGVGARDLPGVRYTCVRGVYGFDGLHKKLRRRSIYGAKIPSNLKTKLRRKYRKYVQV